MKPCKGPLSVSKMKNVERNEKRIRRMMKWIKIEYKVWNKEKAKQISVARRRRRPAPQWLRDGSVMAPQWPRDGSAMAPR